MKTDDERLDELTAAEESLRAQLMLRRDNGRAFYDPDETAKLAQSVARIHSEITAIEHLKLQRRKQEPNDEALDRLTPKELEQRIADVMGNLEKLRSKLPHLQVAR